MCLFGPSAKEPFRRIDRDCLVSGLEACYLKCQEVGFVPYRLCCKTDLAFLDRVLLVLLLHLFLALSPSEVDLFPFPFVFGGYASARWCWRGWISCLMSVYATLALETWLLLGLSARSSAAPPGFSVLEDFLILCCLLQHLEFPAEVEMQRLRCRFEAGLLFLRTPLRKRALLRGQREFPERRK